MSECKYRIRFCLTIILLIYDIVLELYSDSCAVYVFVGEHIALVDFVYCLQRLHLLDKGEYIIISVDDEIYDPDHRLNIIRRGKCLYEKMALC